MHRPTAPPAVLNTLSADTIDALRCPTWCVADPDHGLTDSEVAQSGGIWREHRSAETVVGEMRVQITLAVDYSLDHGLLTLPPTVQVRGDADLLAADAHRLAAVITDHTAFLTSVQQPVTTNA